MDSPQARDRRWGLLGPVALLAPALGVLAWWLLRPEPVPEVRGPGLSVEQPPPTASEQPFESARDGVPIKPAETAPAPSGALMHPHPITPQHERLFRENALIGDLNSAMDVKDVAGLRRLLKQYRDEYPEDAHVLQDGYEIIADCLERPGPETRAVGQRYYDEQLDSGLRRYIRRHCLENSN